MTLQDIRRHFETPVVEVCQSLGITYRPANTLEPNGDAYSEFIEARLQFGQMMENSVGDCVKLENIRGSFIIEYYGPKGRGPARAPRSNGTSLLRDVDIKRCIHNQRPKFYRAGQSSLLLCSTINGHRCKQRRYYL